MNNPTILLVDDEEAIIEITKIRLEHNGFHVIVAQDGNDALLKAQSVLPDLILLDVMLPKMDGYKVCKMLKFDERYRHIPVVILTALSQPSDQDLAYESGADRYLSKPVSPVDLIATINDLLIKKADSSIKDRLRYLACFESLSNDEIEQLQSAATIMPYTSGQTIVDETSSHSEFYVIISGDVEISNSTQQNSKTILGPNAYFGGTQHIDDTLTFTATANGPVICAVFSEKALAKIFDRHPDIKMALNSTKLLS